MAEDTSNPSETGAAAQPAELADSDAPGEQTSAQAPVAMPTSQPVFMRALRWSALSTLALLVVCGAVGWWVGGSAGLIGGVLGALIAGLFLGMTVGSIAFANRFIASDIYLVLFFAIVVGGWLLKFVLFIVAALLLRDQPWLDPKILFFSLIAGVLVSLVIDALIMMKSRIPIISNAP